MFRIKLIKNEKIGLENIDIYVEDDYKNTVDFFDENSTFILLLIKYSIQINLWVVILRYA